MRISVTQSFEGGHPSFLTRVSWVSTEGGENSLCFLLPTALPLLGQDEGAFVESTQQSRVPEAQVSGIWQDQGDHGGGGLGRAIPQGRL